MEEMSIESIKAEMKSFRDFYGGDLLGVDCIDECKTKHELAQIIDEHENHIEMMLSDAQRNLYRFKERIGLTLL